MLPIASLSPMSAPITPVVKDIQGIMDILWDVSFFQGLALGVKYFYKLNPDFLLEVINDYLVYAPTEVCIIITVRFLFVLFFFQQVTIGFSWEIAGSNTGGRKTQGI